MNFVPADQQVRQIQLGNPWWEAPHTVSPIYGEWQPRPYLDAFFPLLERAGAQRAVVLMGPRRVGKTVMLHHAIARLLEQGIAPASIAYFSVDHPLFTGLGLGELLDLYHRATGVSFRQVPGYFFFDEIQYLRDWERHLKALVDEHGPSKFVVSGSAAAALRLKSTESGAGRFTDFLLPPLTFFEYRRLLGKPDITLTELVDCLLGKPDLTFQELFGRIAQLNEEFVHYLNYGGYPEVIFSKDVQNDPARFIKSDIIDKVLLRDLPGLYGIQDTQELNQLFTMLAYHTGQEVSLDSLSERSHVSKNTLKKYIQYLETAFLIQIVHRIDRNARRFQRANFFKAYLTNPSLRTALFGPLDADDPQMGALVETGIFAQWFHRDQTLHYARWGTGEVDGVVLDARGRPAWVLEIKWSDRWLHNLDEIRPVLDFVRRNAPDASCQVTTRTRIDRVKAGETTVVAIPAGLSCLEVGRAVFDAIGRGIDVRRRIWPDLAMPDATPGEKGG